MSRVRRSDIASAADRPRGALGLRLFAAACAAVGAASPAFAGCAPGPWGPRDYLCSGTIPGQTFTDARTLSLAGVTATGGLSIAPTGFGNIGVLISADSKITAGSGNGFSIVTKDGEITSSAPASSGIYGTITASAGIAFFAQTGGTGGNISLNFMSGSSLTGSAGGLKTVTDGAGVINLTLNGTITSAGGVGVMAQTVDGAINITANGAITGALGGIVANATGAGSIAITDTAAIASVSGWGVQATSSTGNVTLDLSGAITAKNGVYASSGGGDVTVKTSDTVKADVAGIYAATSGKGAMTVTTGDTVTAGTGDGVVAVNEEGVNSITIGTGGVTAGGNGVIGQSTSGSLKIASHGDISGATGFGVAAVTTSGSIQIDLDAGTFVSGEKAGVAIATTSGTAVLNNAAQISGGLTGAGLYADLGTGELTVNNSGTITAASGVAIDIASGAALIKNTGVIDGQILSAGTTTLNNNGKWLNADGSVIQYLNNNGLITMGALGSTGALMIMKDAVFGKDTILNMRIAADSSDVIVIGGTGQIDGGVINITGKEKTYQRGLKYQMIYADGGITGKFDAVVSDLDKYTGVLTYDEKDVYLMILQRDFRYLALNRNQYAVANAIFQGSGRLASGPGADLMTAINLTPDAGIPNVLTQLSGDGVVTGAANAAMSAGHLFTSVLEDQQALWRTGGRDVNSVTLREPFAYAPTRVEGNKWPVSRQAYRPVERPRDPRRTWRMWAAGFGGKQSFAGDANAGSVAQTGNTYGGAMGVDYQAGTNMLLGFALGYSTSNFQAGATSVQGKTDAVHFGAYTGFRVRDFYGTASVAYSSFQNETSRTVGGFGGSTPETLKGKFGSEEVRTRLEMGRRLSADMMSITPFTAIEIAHLHTKPFVESASTFAGGPGLFNLAFQGQGMNSAPTFVGAKMEARVDLGAGMAFTPWLSIAWRHEWAQNRTQTATLVALPTASFVAIGAKPHRDSLSLKGGAQVELTRTAALFATFEGEFLSKNPVYSGKGGVKIGW